MICCFCLLAAPTGKRLFVSVPVSPVCTWTVNKDLTPALTSVSTEVFEELTAAVQEKDALASELHVRHVAIEQLFKNCAKLPWLHISRAGVKASSNSGGAVE